VTGAFALTILASLLAFDPPKNDPVRAELKRLEGTWEAVEFEAEGRKMSAKDLAGGQPPMVQEYKGDRLLVKQGGKVVEEGTVKLDPTRAPKTMDLTGKQDGREATLRAIYELTGDTLRVCYRPEGRPRPTEFKAEGQAMILTLKRQKP
jgi:uncharacterized protein (TIGR03067 family)